MSYLPRVKIVHSDPHINSHGGHGTSDWPEKSFPKSGSNQVNLRNLQEHSRERARNLLHEAFPAPTDREVSEKAAEFLGCSPRTVRNWLSKQNSMPFDVAFAIGCMIGVWRTMEVLTLGQSRGFWFNKIVQKVVRRGF